MNLSYLLHLVSSIKVCLLDKSERKKLGKESTDKKLAKKFFVKRKIIGKFSKMEGKIFTSETNGKELFYSLSLPHFDFHNHVIKFFVLCGKVFFCEFYN